MTHKDEAESGGWELVMPFVACQSQGGLYEDRAFVAGFQAGQVDRALAAIAAVEGEGLMVTVPGGIVKQLDLIAMRYGYHMIEKAPYEDGAWVTWSCRRSFDGVV